MCELVLLPWLFLLISFAQQRPYGSQMYFPSILFHVLPVSDNIHNIQILDY
jgi:hypothetical protein